MTPIEKYLKEVKERCEAATEGPWENEDYRYQGDWRSCGVIWARINGDFHPGKLVCKIDCDDLHSGSGKKIKEFEDNAAFIAHSRTDVPRLLEMIELLIDWEDEFALKALNQIAKGEVR